MYKRRQNFLWKYIIARKDIILKFWIYPVHGYVYECCIAIWLSMLLYIRLTYIFNIMFVHCVASKMVLQIRLDNPNIFKIPKLNFIATENKLIKWMRWKKLTLEIIKMKNNFIDKWEIFSSSFVCCVLLLIYAN